VPAWHENADQVPAWHENADQVPAWHENADQVPAWHENADQVPAWHENADQVPAWHENADQVPAWHENADQVPAWHENADQVPAWHENADQVPAWHENADHVPDSSSPETHRRRFGGQTSAHSPNRNRRRHPRKDHHRCSRGPRTTVERAVAPDREAAHEPRRGRLVIGHGAPRWRHHAGDRVLRVHAAPLANGLRNRSPRNPPVRNVVCSAVETSRSA
jgi:hypothetical protein